MKDKFEIKDTMGLGSIIVALILIWIILVDYFSVSCETPIEACEQIMKDTAYYPLALMAIVAGVVIAILIKFRNEKKVEG